MAYTTHIVFKCRPYRTRVCVLDFLVRVSFIPKYFQLVERFGRITGEILGFIHIGISLVFGCTTDGFESVAVLGGRVLGRVFLFHLNTKLILLCHKKLNLLYSIWSNNKKSFIDHHGYSYSPFISSRVLVIVIVRKGYYSSYAISPSKPAFIYAILYRSKSSQV